MATQPARHRFTADEYERMGAAGLFAEGARLELIEGEVVEMTPIGSRHAACVARLTRLFAAAVADRAIVWVQNPVRLGIHSEPQPDLTLLRSRDDFYAGGHPGPDDILLVVEVSDTTATWDRDVKAALYATAGVPETWVVDLTAGLVHVFSDPGPDGYTGRHQATAGETISSAVLGAAEPVPVSDILGPA